MRYAGGKQRYEYLYSIVSYLSALPLPCPNHLPHCFCYAGAGKIPWCARQADCTMDRWLSYFPPPFYIYIYIFLSLAHLLDSSHHFFGPIVHLSTIIVFEKCQQPQLHYFLWNQGPQPQLSISGQMQQPHTAFPSQSLESKWIPDSFACLPGLCLLSVSQDAQAWQWVRRRCRHLESTMKSSRPFEESMNASIPRDILKSQQGMELEIKELHEGLRSVESRLGSKFDIMGKIRSKKLQISLFIMYALSTWPSWILIPPKSLSINSSR